MWKLEIASPARILSMYPVAIKRISNIVICLNIVEYKICKIIYATPITVNRKLVLRAITNAKKRNMARSTIASGIEIIPLAIGRNLLNGCNLSFLTSRMSLKI